MSAYPGRKKGEDEQVDLWVGAGSLAADRWRPKRTVLMLLSPARKVNVIAGCWCRGGERLTEPRSPELLERAADPAAESTAEGGHRHQGPDSIILNGFQTAR